MLFFQPIKNFVTKHYQLDFVTPTISPFEISSRKAIREHLKARRTPLPRPVITQRFFVRTAELFFDTLFNLNINSYRRDWGKLRSCKMALYNSRWYSTRATRVLKFASFKSALFMSIFFF